MNKWLEIYYFSIFSSALLLSLLGVWFTAIVPGIDRWSKRFFLRYFIVFLLCCLSGFMEIVAYYYSASSTAVYVILILECLFLSLPLLMLTAYLMHCCGENIRGSRLFHIVLGLWAVFLVMIFSNPLHQAFVFALPGGRYQRGPLYSVVLLPVIAIQLLNLASAIRRQKRLSRKAFYSFLTAILPMMAALVVNMFVEAFPLLDISYVLSALSMYSFILSDQIEQDLCHQQEIANQRASIAVLQMRPHFIYNTMTTIYCLCDQDPQLARRVIIDFTTYLRKNFNAIASPTLIPFSSELEHTRAYLAVEQALYEDSLFVEYDTPHTWFRVPPLTLQPIVENAVKHGRNPYAGPFHISIRTRKTDSGSEIVVADNGRGLDPTDDGEPHIALKNIDERLEVMCGGHLTITSGDGCGTVVTLTIPGSPAK